MKKIIEKINQEQMKKNLPNVRVGDTVRVQVKIIEGDKERVQAYTGTVISKTGSGINQSIRVRRISFGEGVERVFLVHSPRVEKIEVTKVGDVRRAKLYYLRNRAGKKGKIAQKQQLLVEGETATPEAPQEGAASTENPSVPPVGAAETVAALPSGDIKKA